MKNLRKSVYKMVVVVMAFLFTLSFAPLQSIQAIGTPLYISDVEAEEQFIEALLEIAPNFDLDHLYDTFESNDDVYYPWELPDEVDFPDYFISLTEFGQPLSEEAIAFLPYMRCTSCSTFTHTRISGPTRQATNVSFGWHPDVNRAQRVSAWWFAHNTSSASASIGLNIGVFSVGFSYSRAGGSGFSINTSSSNVLTRPQIRGNVDTSVWRVQERHNASGQVIRTWNETRATSSGIFISIRNENGTCNRVC